MTEDPLPSMEEMVLAEINDLFESFAPVLLAQSQEEPTKEEARAMFQFWGSVVQRQGVILARMSMFP